MRFLSPARQFSSNLFHRFTRRWSPLAQSVFWQKNNRSSVQWHEIQSSCFTSPGTHGSGPEEGLAKITSVEMTSKRRTETINFPIVVVPRALPFCPDFTYMYRPTVPRSVSHAQCTWDSLGRITHTHILFQEFFPLDLSRFEPITSWEYQSRSYNTTDRLGYHIGLKCMFQASCFQEDCRSITLTDFHSRAADLWFHATK